MTSSEDPSILTCHQFPRWSTSITRPRSSLPSKDAQDMFQLGIDNRHLHQRTERPTSSSVITTTTTTTPPAPIPHVIRHRVRIPSVPRISSPLLHQPTSSPEILSVVDRSSPTSANASRPHRPMPFRLKSTTLTVPQASPESSLQNFPKQSHERRKSAQNRKRRKQQAQTLAGKYAETETWFQLRQSLAELKRLATTQQIVVDPTLSLFNCDGYSFEALKQAMMEQQEIDKIALLNSESGVSSSCDSVLFSHFPHRSNTTFSQTQPLSYGRSGRRATVTYERPGLEPLLVASKPIHPLIAVSNHQPAKPKEKHNERSPSAPPRPRPPPVPVAPVAERRAQLLVSDLSNDEDLVLPSTPPSIIIQEEPQSSSRRLAPLPSVRPRPPSSVTMSSNIKLKPQVPRCRSAMDSKSHSTKHLPRFILIADQEHRIESWYHQYPFVLSDDLLNAFESSQQKSTIQAFFTDDIHLSNHNSSTKTFLQGKPFHIQNDWRKYDLIFISNNIYEQIMNYLQIFIYSIGSSTNGKQIRIYQINHEEDLKVQVRSVCRNIQQQNL